MTSLNDCESPIEAAFDQAFTNPPYIEPTEPGAPSSPLPHHAADTPTIPESPSLEEKLTSVDEWKQELEQLSATWKANSAAAREKAEKERARWDAIRAAEREQASHQKAAGVVAEPGITSASSSTTVFATSSSHNEQERSGQSMTPPPSTAEPSGVIARPYTSLSNTAESQRWEDVHSSRTSSFPSMSFPEPVDTPPRTRRHATPQREPLSATLTVFDSSLSTKTRIQALLSSVTINMLLPFINGVMLGFGEIFAKEFIMKRLGWHYYRPGSTTATLGLSSKTARR